MSTGIAEIDHQHQRMIQLLNALIRAVGTDDAGKTLALLLPALKSYADTHFACEEDCMNRRHCQAASKNRAEHERFSRMVDAFRKQIDTHGITRDLAMDVERQLAFWVIEHIGTVDRELIHCAGTSDLATAVRGDDV